MAGTFLLVASFFLAGLGVMAGVPFNNAELDKDADPSILRIAHAGQFVHKLSAGIDDVQIGLKVICELSFNGRSFVFPQQPVVDEDTRELRPDRLVQNRGGH